MRTPLRRPFGTTAKRRSPPGCERGPVCIVVVHGIDRTAPFGRQFAYCAYCAFGLIGSVERSHFAIWAMAASLSGTRPAAQT